MKKFIVILLSNFIFTISFAQTDAAYRIFGEIMTVENKVYKGFITWNGNKNYWIDFFEPRKLKILIVPISKGATDWFSEQTTGNS